MNGREGRGLAEREDELRIVLLGKTGVGKSSTGNTILGRDAFKAGISEESVTKETQKEACEINCRHITVIDTPGLFDTELTNEEIQREIRRCISMILPGPHVFIIVLNLGQRFTKEEETSVKFIKETFGEHSLMFTVVLFTRGDFLKDKTLDQCLGKPGSVVRKLLETCGNRYHVFNNNQPEDRTQVSDLLKMIDNMVKANGGSFYSCKMFREMEREKQEQQMKILMDRVRETEEEMKKLEEEKDQNQENERKRRDKLKREMRETQDEMKREQERFRNEIVEMRKEKERIKTEKENLKTEYQTETDRLMKRIENEKKKREEENTEKEEKYKTQIKEEEEREMCEEMKREQETLKHETEQVRTEKEKRQTRYNTEINRLMNRLENERENHDKERKRREEEFKEREEQYKIQMSREREEWEKQIQEEKKRREEDEKRRATEKQILHEQIQRLKREMEEIIEEKERIEREKQKQLEDLEKSLKAERKTRDQQKTLDLKLKLLQKQCEDELKRGRAISTFGFAKIICQKLKEPIEQSVYKKTARDLTNEIKLNCESLNGNRSNLEKHILKTLAEEEDFDKYMNYIHYPRGLYKSFIRDEVRRYIRDTFSISVLPKMKENIKLLQQKIMNAAHQSTEHVQVNSGDVGLWLKSFTQQLSDQLIFSEKDLSGVKHDDVDDFRLLEDVIRQELTAVMSDISGRFNTDTFPVKLDYKFRPDELLIDHFCQCCWVQCPFCRAICTNTRENHDGDHSVAFHRVFGLNGQFYAGTRNLSINICTSAVASDQSFYLTASAKSVFWRDYRTAGGVYADWSITPDLSELPYWKWFVCRFEKDLENYYRKTFQRRGGIPFEWRCYIKQDAIESLDAYI